MAHDACALVAGIHASLRCFARVAAAGTDVNGNCEAPEPGVWEGDWNDARHIMGIHDFQVVCKLGLGAYGSVYKAERKVDGLTYAIKRVKLEGLDQQDLAMTLNEIRLLASFRHPRIVRLHEAFMDTRAHLCVVMEYCGFQDLERKIKRYRARGEHVDERVVWVYLVQTLEALQALHSLKVLHRDIKPANILLDEEGNAKLGDLNVSKCVDDGGEVQTVMGTLPYMAPEIWQDKPYDFASDLYSLGCTLFELAALAAPFDGPTALHIRRAVLKRQFHAAMPEEVYSEDLRGMILTLMHPDPEARLTAEKLLSEPQVASRLYLVRHKLPTDLPPPTPLTPYAAIEEGRVALEELPALLMSLLPVPSYPAAVSPPAGEREPGQEQRQQQQQEEEDSDGGSLASNGDGDADDEEEEAQDPHRGDKPPRKPKTGRGRLLLRRLRLGGQLQHHHHQHQHRHKKSPSHRRAPGPLVERGDAAAGEPSPSSSRPDSLRLLLQSPFKEDAASPLPAAPSSASSPLAPPAEAPQPPRVSPVPVIFSSCFSRPADDGRAGAEHAHQQQQPLHHGGIHLLRGPHPLHPHRHAHPHDGRRRRPPALPTAALGKLGLQEGAGSGRDPGAAGAAGVAGAGHEERKEQQQQQQGEAGAALPAMHINVGASAAALAPSGSINEEVAWERVPTPSSLTVPMPSPSPASPFELPPGLAPSPRGKPEGGPRSAQGHATIPEEEQIL